MLPGTHPAGAGFIMHEDEAADHARADRGHLSRRGAALPRVTTSLESETGAQRWVIDFAHMPLEAAMQYPAALDIVRDSREARRGRPTTGGRIGDTGGSSPSSPSRCGRPHGLGPYIVGVAQGKRFSSCGDRWTCRNRRTKSSRSRTTTRWVFWRPSPLARGLWSRGSTLQGQPTLHPIDRIRNIPVALSRGHRL